MKLWLDDVRRPPDDSWTWAKDYRQAIISLSAMGHGTATITHMSFDHDLGKDELGPEKNGYHVALWMAEHEVWPTQACYVHSANPVGARNIAGVIDRYGPYAQPVRWTPADLDGNPLPAIG